MTNLSDVDFRDYYENKHAPLASSLLTLEKYERNYVNSELNPLYASLGSISIFQYQSIQSLEIVGNEMASSAGDILRDDERKFMDVPKNYHVFTESNQLTMSKFNKKIFVWVRCYRNFYFLGKCLTAIVCRHDKYFIGRFFTIIRSRFKNQFIIRINFK